MRTRVLVGEGRFQPDVAAHRELGQPCPEFVFLAERMQASIASFTTAAARRGQWFQHVFQRWPLLGSAIGAALESNSFDVLYCVSEELGMFAAPLLRLRRWKGRLITVVHGISAKKAAVVQNCRASRNGRSDHDQWDPGSNPYPRLRNTGRKGPLLS